MNETELPGIRKAIEALPREQRRALLEWLIESERGVAVAEPAPPAIRKPKPVRRPAAPATLRQAVLWSIASIAVFFLLDAAIFRSGWYLRYLAPDSTTGQLELNVFWLRHTLPGKAPEAAVIGDSRVAEGFSARNADAGAGDRIHFWNLGVPGSSPRDWYYLLRDGDPDHRRFTALAIAMDRYSDEDGGENPSNRMSDLSYSVGRLRWSDCPDFAESYDAPELRRTVLTGCLFRGVTLRRDVQDFFAHPLARFRAAKAWRNDGKGYIDGYGGKPEDLTGLSVDFGTGAVNFPPGLKDWQKNSVNGFASSAKVPQTGALTAYRKLWLGRILDLYKDSPTRIIFLELPGGPLPPPRRETPARFIESVWRRPRVTVLPGETFRDLERPEVYADGLHLNHAGRPIFSERLGAKMAEIAGSR